MNYISLSRILFGEGELRLPVIYFMTFIYEMAVCSVVHVYVRFSFMRRKENIKTQIHPRTHTNKIVRTLYWAKQFSLTLVAWSSFFVYILHIPLGYPRAKEKFNDEDNVMKAYNKISKIRKPTEKNPIFCDLAPYFAAQFHIWAYIPNFFFIYIIRKTPHKNLWNIFIEEQENPPKKLGSSKWTMHGVFKRQWSVEEFVNQNLQKIIILNWVDVSCVNSSLENSVKILWTLQFHKHWNSHSVTLIPSLVLSLSPSYLA